MSVPDRDNRESRVHAVVRRSRRARPLRALAVALAAVALFAPPAEAEIPRKAAFLEAVDKAIDRGAEWLLGQQEKDGGWIAYREHPGGTTALAYHTLRVCGVPREDPRMERAYAALRKAFTRAKKSRMLRTYSVALMMLAIESHGRLRDDPDAAEPGAARTLLDGRDLGWMDDCVSFLEKRQNGIGAWRYGRQGPSNKNYDHSNMQYALLGLKAASRCGVKVRTGTYLHALEHLLDAQEKDGPKVDSRRPTEKGGTAAGRVDQARGWGYFSLRGKSGDTGDGKDEDPVAPAGQPQFPKGAYGSMTAGSVGAVVICRSELVDRNGYAEHLDRRAETAVRDGIAWLGHHFDVRRNPNCPSWLFYYLYAMERAGVLAGVDWMGGHDWYGEGAKLLLETQQPDGRWVYSEPIMVPTCFALLFLKRGTIAVRRGALTSSTAASSINFDVAATLSARDFEDFIDLVLSKWARATDDPAARAELQRRTTAVGPRIVLPLLQRMGSRREDKRAAAHAVLDHATAQHFPFDAAAPPARRFEQMERWETWFGLVAGSLVYDAEKGRLVTR